LKRRRPLAFKLGVLALCVVLAALVAAAVEYGYRLVHLRKLTLQASMWVPDPDLVYALNPESTTTLGGFRSGAPAPKKTTAYRIVCLGASTTFGHKVRDTEAWPHVLETKLRERHLDAEVINAGVPGYGMRQLLVRYRRDLAALEADVFLICEGWNRAGALVDPYGWVPVGIPSRNDPWYKTFAFALAEHSIILRQYLTQRVVQSEKARRPRPNLDPYHQVFVDDLRALVEAMPVHGHRPVLILYPSLLHEGMSADEKQRCQAMMFEGRKLDDDSLRELQQKHAALRAVASETGAAVIDVQGALAPRSSTERTQLFLDEMHLNVRGNAEVAEIVAAQLAPLLAR
jgi:lysophospholipase L1-like esterase